MIAGWRGAWGPARSLAVLVAVAVSVVTGGPSRQPVVTVLALAGVAAGWLLWTFPRTDGWRLVGFATTGLCGLLLAYTNPKSGALAYPVIVCIRSAADLPPRRSVPLAGGLCAVFLIGLGATPGGWYWWLLGPGLFLASVGGGLLRRQNLRLQQDAAEARAQEAALDERNRIAREIHDVLAHTLSALTVQLETANALLERGRDGQAREMVVRASQLAREGLAETRRAIGALRGDTLPLPDLLRALATGYRTDLDADATVTVDGVPRELGPDTGLALYRTAQEALTNVRKHAPGAPVAVHLAYQPDGVDLTIANGPPTTVHELAGSGSGYGLTGLRERAELAGGRLSAGPLDGGWRVAVRIPT